MSRKARRNKQAQGSPDSQSLEGSHRIGSRELPSGEPKVRVWSGSRIFLAVLVVVIAVGIAASLIFQKETPKPGVNPNPSLVVAPSSRHQGAVTFTKDVAPIIFKNCASCHRPEQSGPFSLLNYEQVKKHARQIAEVTASRFMPPWPPEPGFGHFVGERRLSDEQIDTIQAWVKQGTAEGDIAALPPLPTWTNGWLLGPPDLVVGLPQAYTLKAEGIDLYRNFVFPIPLDRTRYVKGVEFKPGNSRVVHHAFINVDETRHSRHLAEKESPPGFDGMDLPETAVMPAGQLLGWQPGKVAYQVADGLSWILRSNTDLVLQLHMRPSGKSEIVQPSIGFYFTDQPPTNFPFRIRVVNFELNIPPGQPDYLAEQSYLLPVDVSLLRVNPHAHYLGKSLQGYAVLPNGEKKWLLWIKDWDFNWQGDYEYAEPINLPKGTRLCMRYVYDNSTNNVRNPNHPPVWVRHGPNTSDEMAALGFQALARNEQDRQILAKDAFDYLVRTSLEYERFLLRLDPNDVAALIKLGRILSSQGKFNEALEPLRAAIRINPQEDKAHYELGYVYLALNQLAQAAQEFQLVLRLNPQDSQAYGNLGLIFLKQRRIADAKIFLESALKLDPDDPVALKNLALVKQLNGVR